jgi:hypothetical protein
MQHQKFINLITNLVRGCCYKQLDTNFIFSRLTLNVLLLLAPKTSK